MNIASRISSLLPSRQAVRESAHPAASGVFHPDAAGWAPVPVPLGARGLRPVSGTLALPKLLELL